MKLGFLKMMAISVVAVVCGCEKNQVVDSPKAVPVRQDGAIELDLMSLNIRYENPGDVGSHAWKVRSISAIRMILRRDPDVIGIQEALHGQAADLRASLPDYGFVGRGRDDGKKAGEYAGILYNRIRFQADPDDQGMFWLSDAPERPGSKTWGNEIPRIAAWVRLKDLATGRSFYVFNTHWDHRNQPSRERSAVLIASRIDGRKHPDEPVALIGDFNSIESNPGIIYLTGRKVALAGSERFWKNGLTDVYQALHPKERNRRTLHLWRNSRDGGLKVDHILVSKGAVIRQADILSGDQPMISDHFPVTAKVLFPLKN